MTTNAKAQSFIYIDDHCFGTSAGEEGKAIARLNQLNVIAGHSICYYSQQDKTDPNCELTGSSKDIWIVAFDDSLHKKWDKNYGTNSPYDDSYSIIPYKQGFLVAGHTNGDSSCNLITTTKGNWDYILLYLDSLGNKINETRFGSIGNDKLCSAAQTLDGGLLLSGSSNGVHSFDKSQNAFYYPNQNPFQAEYDLWVIKLDSLGNKQWDRIFGGLDRDAGEGIGYLHKTQGHTILKDSSYLVYGETISGVGGNITSSPISPNYGEAIVFKVDKNGNKIWDKRYGCTGCIGWTGLVKIIEMENYYYLFGFKENTLLPNYQQDLWIVKTDTSGNIIWEKNYGTSEIDLFADVLLNTQGGFFALGSIAIANGSFLNPGYGAYDAVIMNFDTSGALLTYKYLGANNSDFGNALTLINDSTLLISATGYDGISNVKHDVGHGYTDIWAVKVGYSTTTTSLNQLQNNLSLTVRPNPAKDQINITGLPPGSYVLQTYNIDGRLVMSDMVTSVLSLPLSIETLQSGMYITNIKNEKVSTTVRWVKE